MPLDVRTRRCAALLAHGGAGRDVLGAVAGHALDAHGGAVAAPAPALLELAGALDAAASLSQAPRFGAAGFAPRLWLDGHGDAAAALTAAGLEPDTQGVAADTAVFETLDAHGGAAGTALLDAEVASPEVAACADVPLYWVEAHGVADTGPLEASEAATDAAAGGAAAGNWLDAQGGAIAAVPDSVPAALSVAQASRYLRSQSRRASCRKSRTHVVPSVAASSGKANTGSRPQGVL